MRSAVVVDAVRSPMGKGKPGGALSDVHAVELLAQVFTRLLARHDIDPGRVDDVLVGCVSQVGEQSSTPGRQAWLAAGLPVHVPSTTIDRRCGSSQQAIHFAAQGVLAGAYELVIAAGVESMSRVPMGSARLGGDPFGPSVTRRFAPGLVPQGVSAELVAERWKLTREELDAYAVRSHARAAADWAAGRSQREVVPIELSPGSASRVVDRDETIRSGTTEDVLATLKPVFAQPPFVERFPHIDWKVTAGNSSQLTDGAAAMLIASEDFAARLGLPARARFHSFGLAADDPIMMLTAPIPATTAVLGRANLSIDQIDVFEVNEAFASVPLMWQREFPVDDSVLNPRGGAIALGHPLGASGVRVMTTLVGGLESRGGRYGLQVMCEGGGMANATVIERL